MIQPKSTVLLGLLTALLSACASSPVEPDSLQQSLLSSKREIMKLTPEKMEAQPLLAVWKGSYGGLPPFATVEIAAFKPALEAGMADMRAEIAAIVDNPAAPNFENTIASFEDCGRPLNRVERLFAIWSGTLSNPELRSIEQEMAPRMASFEDEITQNEKLFQRIEQVYKSPELKKLNPEQQRLTWHHYTNFQRAGASLDGAKKQRLTAINQRLASLFTSFNQNLLKDESSAIFLDHESDLAGMPDSFKQSAALAAAERGEPKKWAITNTRSSVEPFLSYGNRSDLREKVWLSFTNRGDLGNANDNNQIISEILLLRAERAKLLGYATHAHWRLEKSMAKTPERAMALMEEVWKPAIDRVHEEVQEMLLIATKENGKKLISPWDYRYYAEKVRKEKYALSDREIKPYLQLETLREGMFWVAGELFNFSFSPLTGIALAHPDIRVWEVKDKTSGKTIGLWYFDPYARPGKRSGAWMNSYRNQEKFRGEVLSIVSNNSNFVKAAAGEPVLISLDDASTLFHEFGHALHGLSSNVVYPSVSGTAVPRDYVEFPSQLLENWLLTPEVLGRFALHYQTKKPMPKDLVAKIKKAGKFNQGFQTLEYLSSALVDMKYHLKGEVKIDPKIAEKAILDGLGMPKEIVMRHRSAQFSHVFGGDSYSAGYYSYLWADTLSASAFEAFTEGKGPYDKTVAQRLKLSVLAVGNSVDPADAFKSFRGRDPDSDALMRRRGFPVIKR